MNGKKIISVYSELQPDEPNQGYVSDDSRLEQRRPNTSALGIEKVKESISEFSNTITELLSSLPDNETGFSVDQIEAHAFIDFEGGIHLIGAKFGSKIQGGLKFVWRRTSK